MEKTNEVTNEMEQRRSMEMNGSPAKAAILFGALAAAGTALTANADRLATGFHQTVLAEIGSAIFGGGFAFFLVEMFRWAREHKTIR